MVEIHKTLTTFTGSAAQPELQLESKLALVVAGQNAPHALGGSGHVDNDGTEGVKAPFTAFMIAAGAPMVPASPRPLALRAPHRHSGVARLSNVD